MGDCGDSRLRETCRGSTPESREHCTRSPRSNRTEPEFSRHKLNFHNGLQPVNDLSSSPSRPTPDGGTSQIGFVPSRAESTRLASFRREQDQPDWLRSVASRISQIGFVPSTARRLGSFRRLEAIGFVPSTARRLGSFRRAVDEAIGFVPSTATRLGSFRRPRLDWVRSAPRRRPKPARVVPGDELVGLSSRHRASSSLEAGIPRPGLDEPWRDLAPEYLRKKNDWQTDKLAHSVNPHSFRRDWLVPSRAGSAR